MQPSGHQQPGQSPPTRSRRQHELPLARYALIGDGRTAALVATDGSIDWMCYGRFDGPAVFCRLLDRDRGGFFQVAPDGDFESSHHYVDDTNVLVTDFACATGVMRVTDCMPVELDQGPVILRKLEGISGDVPVRLHFAPTFDFARAPTTIDLLPEGCLARDATVELRLSSPVHMELTDDGATGIFRLAGGEVRWVVMTHGTRPLAAEAAEHALASTMAHWQRWLARGHYPGPCDKSLRRSALTLKLLIHGPTGAPVASPTTSLPETAGGVRNWDYRFTWLRDSSWMVDALMQLGHHEESMAFIDWLARLKLTEGPPSVFYDLDGEPPADEHELTHLRGYMDAQPIRVGNAAAGQFQHDILGEVVSAIHMCSQGMPSMRPLEPRLWSLVAALAERAANHWNQPDHGMWEVRDRPRQFLSSQMMCWAALDRALAIARRDDLPGPLERWQQVRDRIRATVLSQGFDPVLHSFRRAHDEHELDAAALLLPRHGLVRPDDARMIATVATIRQRLSLGGGLLRRYLADDGLPGREGAFTACSFWLVDVLARQRRVHEARELLERVTCHASDLGLMSEQIDPGSGELLGNYPQAFTHLALIRAAVSIAEAEARTRRELRTRATDHRDPNRAGGPMKEEQVVVITGASSGVGRAIARAFGQQRARVALIARGTDGLEATAREVQHTGGEALVLPLDVSDAAAVDAAADEVVRRWGHIDVWINDAMISVFSPVWEMRADEYRRVMDVNYLGYVHGTLAALRHMRAHDRGVIIQIGSALAYRSIPLQSAYCASKAAIRGFTDSLRSELIHENSRVKLCMLQLPAVNTPQFEVVRNRLAGHPRPVPPIYQPEVIARAAVQAAAHPRREVWIGWSALEAILGQRFIPGVLDRWLAKKAWAAQTTTRLPPGHPIHHHQDNVDTPLPGDRGAHGPFDARARRVSTQRWMRRHLGLTTAGAGLLIGAILWPTLGRARG